MPIDLEACDPVSCRRADFITALNIKSAGLGKTLARAHRRGKDGFEGEFGALSVGNGERERTNID